MIKPPNPISKFRWDYLFVECNLPVADDEVEDLHNLEFQSKSLDGEFLSYKIDADGFLWMQDYFYELVGNDVDDKDFEWLMYKLRRRSGRWRKYGLESDAPITEMIFYGKPYEKFYRFKATFLNNKIQSIKIIS